MSADGLGPGWPVQAAVTWRLTLPCTREEALRLAGEVPEVDALDPPPVLMTSEPDPAAPARWRLDAYFEGEPEPAAVALVRALVPSAAGDPATPAPVEDRDWVTESQAFLRPIRAGRFLVHTAAHADAVPADAVAFRIEASRAFGTGHHETTAGCLELLDRLERGGARFAAVADIGTGTGLLALAARALWPAARLLAADIDPVAVEVAAGNLADHGIADAALVVAAGTDHPAIAAAAPFDLVLANILAGPLIALAPAIAAAVAPGGLVVLAGLVADQEQAVAAAYRAGGFAAADRLQRGEWPVLAMRRIGPGEPLPG